jgi:hypothetical protein
MKSLGYRFITLLNELRLLQWSTSRALAALRSGETRADAP